ncbi:MAG TPA: hypothetical protein DCL21_05950 [Alphaproteobacteria bacterium]|nr:hypothetical protein [Alphaproteobacteria bacterium]
MKRLLAIIAVVISLAAVAALTMNNEPEMVEKEVEYAIILIPSSDDATKVIGGTRNETVFAPIEKVYQWEKDRLERASFKGEISDLTPFDKLDQEAYIVRVKGTIEYAPFTGRISDGIVGAVR